MQAEGIVRIETHDLDSLNAIRFNHIFTIPNGLGFNIVKHAPINKTHDGIFWSEFKVIAEMHGSQYNIGPNQQWDHNVMCFVLITNKYAFSGGTD